MIKVKNFPLITWKPVIRSDIIPGWFTLFIDSDLFLWSLQQFNLDILEQGLVWKEREEPLALVSPTMEPDKGILRIWVKDCDGMILVFDDLQILHKINFKEYKDHIYLFILKKTLFSLRTFIVDKISLKKSFFISGSCPTASCKSCKFPSFSYLIFFLKCSSSSISIIPFFIILIEFS